MKRAVLVLVSVLTSAPLWAQVGATPSPSPMASAANPSLATAFPSAQAQPAARSAPAPPADAVPRRRPSMVGYIGDSTIATQVRVRFDAGFEITAADRAEFFYAKCGCYRGLPPSHPGFDPDAAGPGPGIASDIDFQQLYLFGEYAVARRFSIYGEVPVRWIQPQAFVPDTGSFGSQSGLSDIRAGVKVGLVDRPGQSLTVQFQSAASTGKASKGLGTDHWTVEPAVLFYQSLADRIAIESQFGFVIPTDGSAGVPTTSDDKFSGSVMYYGVGPSFEVYRSNRVRVAPVVELVGWHVMGGFQTAGLQEADGTDIVNLKVGARLVFDDQGSLYVGYGHALTDATWYDDVVRLEYRYRF